MARIAGVSIPLNKRVEVSLTYIKGVGRVTSRKILKELNISPDVRVKDLSEQDVNKLRQVVEKNYKVEGDLKREWLSNIKRLKEINSWRGLRHSKGLPVRGQSTKTNSRTVRGNVRKTGISGKVKLQKT